MKPGDPIILGNRSAAYMRLAFFNGYYLLSLCSREVYINRYNIQA